MRKPGVAVLLLVAFATSAGAAKPYKMTGNLQGTGDSEEFKIELKSDKVEIDFDWSVYSRFWVKVYDKKREQIGDFDLKEGDVIVLKGGGVFYLVVYSKFGGGQWIAWWEDWD